MQQETHNANELDSSHVIRTLEGTVSPVLAMDELIFVLGHEDFENLNEADVDKMEYEVERIISTCESVIGVGNDIFTAHEDLRVIIGKIRARVIDPNIDLHKEFADLEHFMELRSSVVPVFSGDLLFSDTVFGDEAVAENIPIRLLPVPLFLDDGSLLRITELYLYSIFVIHCDQNTMHTWSERMQQLFLNAQASNNSGAILVFTENEQARMLFTDLFDGLISDKSKFKLHLCSKEGDFQAFVDDLTSLVDLQA